MDRQEFQNLDWSKPHYFRITHAYQGRKGRNEGKYKLWGKSVGHIRFGATVLYPKTQGIKREEYFSDDDKKQEGYFPCEMLWECDCSGIPLKPYPEEEKAEKPADRREVYTKKCDICGREFKTICKNLRVCSKACARKRKNKAHKIVSCPECGKEFEQKTGQKFCSEACRYEFNRKKGERERRERREKDPRFHGKCPECGREFLKVTLFQIYCSNKCRDKSQYKKRVFREKEKAKRAENKREAKE